LINILNECGVELDYIIKLLCVATFNKIKLRQMKSIFFLFSAILISSNIYSQLYEFDGNMISSNIYGGSSRNIALGGASTALGGDLGSISQNPASIGVFRTSEFSFTPMFNSMNTSNRYLGETLKSSKNDLNLGNIGTVFAYTTGNTDGWIGVNLSFGYNMLNNFTNNYAFHGTTSNTTLGNEFAQFANADPPNLDTYREQLAYDLRVILKDNIGFYSPYSGYKIEQSHYYNRKGQTNEYYFGIGANYEHKLYLGATINMRSAYYDEEFIHTESEPTYYDLPSYTFNKSYSTVSKGYSFNLGAIYRPIETVRLGLSLHSPIVNWVDQQMNTNMVINEVTYYPLDNVGNDVLPSTDKYSVSSPWKAEFGAAYMFLQYGLISFDYEYADYRNMSFSDGDYASVINKVNSMTDKTFKTTHNFRIGAEARFGSAYLRGGYAFYQNPFATSDINKTELNYLAGDKNIYSAGFGFRSNGYFIDFAYSYLTYNESYKMYVDPNLEVAKMYSSNGTFTATLGLKF
jgi:hypothetical protein